MASHLISLHNFTLQNVHFVFYELSATQLALRNTFVLGTLAATAGTILALVIAYVNARQAVTGSPASQRCRSSASASAEA